MTTIVTHNAKFHADDVFAVATLTLLFPEAAVVRSRDENVIASADIVVDVGGVYDPGKDRFDHHQNDAPESRSNGIPYASFGLVWRKYGEKLCSPTIASSVERTLVLPVDALDNGVEISTPLVEEVRDYTVQDFFGSFLTEEIRSENRYDEAFSEVVVIAQGILKREIDIATTRERAHQEVLAIYEHTVDKRIIVLDHLMSWQEPILSKSEPLYIVFEVTDAKWYVRAVPVSHDGFAVRKPLPKSWGGLSGSELEKVTGVSGALFAHKGLFLASAATKDAALALAEIALNS